MTICVQWPQLGPYHRARLRAAAAHAKAHGGRVVALETATRQALYGWQESVADSGFERITLFPGRTLEACSLPEIHHGIRHALDQLQPDVLAINSYSMPDAQAALQWSIRHNRATVLMTDSKADDAPRKGWREWPKRQLVKACQSAVVAGTLSAAYIEQLGVPAGRIWTGYDVVDNAHFARPADGDEAAEMPPGLQDERPFFLASARFIRRKNLPGLLHGYAQYVQQVKACPWRLVLLGDGDLSDEVEALVDAKDLSAHVCLAGFQPYALLPRYYHRAQAFVHTALTEQWGLVVNEAMAAGCPILCSHTLGCVPDLVTDDVHGLLFDPLAPTTIAKALLRCHEDPAARTRWAKAAQTHIQHWGPDRFAHALWHAAHAARSLGSRPWAGRLRASAVLWGIRRTAGSASTFHAVEA